MGNLCTVSKMVIAFNFCQKLTLDFNELVRLHASLQNNDLVPVENKLKEMLADFSKYNKEDRKKILALLEGHIDRSLQNSHQASVASIE